MISLNIGHFIIAATAVFFVIASYSVLFGAFLPLTGNVVSLVDTLTCPVPVMIALFFQVLDALAKDTHYKYFVLLIIPTGAYFVIANWVGWQYYRNS